MEISIGMSREGLTKFAREILWKCEDMSSGGVEITRYVEQNEAGEELVLTFSNEDMEGRDDVTPETAWYEAG